MKRLFGSGMGIYRMGIFLSVLVVLSIGWIIAPAIGSVVENGTKQSGSDTWYIYESRTIVKDISIEQPVVINGSGELILKDGVTVEMFQKYDYQRNITIKDNGTLLLRNGNLESNLKFYIKLQGTGKLILERDSTLKVTQLVSTKNALVRILSSKLIPGKGGLLVEIGGESTLELDDGTITSAEEVYIKDEASLRLHDATIESEGYAISCKEVNLVSNPDLRNLKINSCQYLFIQNSNVTGLDVMNCDNFQSFVNTKIINSKIQSLGNGKLSSADITDLTITKANKLEITNCNVNILKITNSVTNLQILSSDISQLDINECTKLETYNTNFDNSRLQSSLDEVNIYNSKVQHCLFFPEEINIYDSTIIGNKDELSDLTRGREMAAYNTSFNAPLHFTGTSNANLVNCSTIAEIPPKVIVEEDANVNIYWWLEVLVLDNGSDPLPGAKVQICDFFTNQVVDEQISNHKGMAVFALLGNSISKYGWNTKNNKSYFIKGTFGGIRADNSTGIWLSENSKAILELSQVKEEDKEDDAFLTSENFLWFLLIIILVIIVLGILAMGRSRGSPPKTGKPKGPSPESRGKRRKGPIELGEVYGEDFSRGPRGRPRPSGPSRPPRRIRQTRSNGNGEEPDKVAKVSMNKRLKSKPPTPLKPI
jgi:hypothetical protein